MSESPLFGLVIAIFGVFAISAVVGFIVARVSKRAGILIWTTGWFMGIVLIVNYFVEVPVIIVATGFAGLAVSIAFALFDTIAKEASSQEPESQDTPRP